MVILFIVGCLKFFFFSLGKLMIIFRFWISWLGVNIGKEYGVLFYGKKNEKKYEIFVYLLFCEIYLV